MEDILKALFSTGSKEASHEYATQGSVGTGLIIAMLVIFVLIIIVRKATDKWAGCQIASIIVGAVFLVIWLIASH